MRVCITTAYLGDDYPLALFQEQIAQDRFGIHQPTDDPDAADIILFVENPHYFDDPFLRRLAAHPWLKKYPGKCFEYNEHDHPWYTLPGLFFSMPKPYFDPLLSRACRFIRNINPFVSEAGASVTDPEVLYSFAGGRNAPVRDSIFAIKDRDLLLKDTSHFRAYDGLKDQSEGWREYADAMSHSRFILCPRGRAPSSPRLFETMEAGRVPILLADEYVLPSGPAWGDFLITVAESDAAKLPDVVRRYDDRWREMGSAARYAWEEWFAPDVIFHRMVEELADLQRARASAPRLPAFPKRPVLAWAVRHYAHQVVNKLRRR